MEPSLNKNAILALVAIVVLGVGGWYFYSQRSAPPRDATPGVVVSPQTKPDLKTPSPLGENAMGKEDAPVTIVEYASLTCPHCANFHIKFLPEMKKRYIDTGKVRLIFREFPLNDVDLFAYMLARCISSGSSDKYFAIIAVLFEKQEAWAIRQPLPPLTSIAKQAGMTDEGIEACSKNKSVQSAIEWTGENGSKLGVESTPTFFINGKKYQGTFEGLDKVIAELVKD